MIDKFGNMILIPGFANSEFRTPFHLGGDWGGGREEFVLHALDD